MSLDLTSSCNANAAVRLIALAATNLKRNFLKFTTFVSPLEAQAANRANYPSIQVTPAEVNGQNKSKVRNFSSEPTSVGGVWHPHRFASTATSALGGFRSAHSRRGKCAVVDWSVHIAGGVSALNRTIFEFRIERRAAIGQSPHRSVAATGRSLNRVDETESCFVYIKLACYYFLDSFDHSFGPP